MKEAAEREAEADRKKAEADRKKAEEERSVLSRCEIREEHVAR